MQITGRNKRFLLGAVAFVALAIVLGWLWGAKKTRDLESSARGSIAAATTRLQDSLQLSPDAPDAHAKLEEHVKVLGRT